MKGLEDGNTSSAGDTLSLLRSFRNALWIEWWEVRPFLYFVDRREANLEEGD